MNPARRGKMNDKPKDRIAMWMSIIAYILVLMIVIALGVLIYAIVTGANIETVVLYLLYSVFLAIVLRWIMREKRNYKPKDRTTMRMSIIAIILALISALGVMIYSIVTWGYIGTVVFCLLCLVFLAIALRWKAVGGAFFVIIGLFFIFVDETDIITYGIVSLLADIFVLTGLLPLIAGLLFLAIWRRTRIAKVPTSSD